MGPSCTILQLLRSSLCSNLSTHATLRSRHHRPPPTAHRSSNLAVASPQLSPSNSISNFITCPSVSRVPGRSHHHHHHHHRRRRHRTTHLPLDRKSQHEADTVELHALVVVLPFELGHGHARQIRRDGADGSDSLRAPPAEIRRVVLGAVVQTVAESERWTRAVRRDRHEPDKVQRDGQVVADLAVLFVAVGVCVPYGKRAGGGGGGGKTSCFTN